MSVFQNSLPVSKIYSARNVNHRFSALAVNFGTQPKRKLVDFNIGMKELTSGRIVSESEKGGERGR